MFIHSCIKHLATLASLYRFHKGDYAYPKSKIDTCWEKVLLNQCKYNALACEIKY